VAVIIKQSTQRDTANNVEKNVICEKCQSTQVVSKKRGYHSKRMLKVFFSMLGIGGAFTILPALILTFLINTMGVDVPSIVREDIVGIVFGIGVMILFLSFPASLVGGIMGSGTMINHCLNCGHQWSEGKEKG
jgi:hypothetical protein